MKQKNCENCGKTLNIVFSGTKYCNNCALHIWELRKDKNTLKQKLERRKKCSEEKRKKKY